MARAGHRHCGRHQQGRVGDSFSASDQQLIEVVAAGEYARSLAELAEDNARALRRFARRRQRPDCELDDSLSQRRSWNDTDVVAEIGSGDELSKRIYASYQQFRTLISGWSADLRRCDYLNSRGPASSIGRALLCFY